MPYGYRDRTGIVMATGLLMLLAGLGSAFLGPLEMYPFYLFSEGGRFYYEGFGFGSFMFGNIAVQIVGYYIIAALLIPLGYGHLLRRRWARTLFVTLIWCWLVLGAPLGLVFLFTLLSVKDLSLAAALAATVAVGLSYAVAPWLLLRMYNSRDIRHTFENADSSEYWIDNTPIPILILACLFVLYAIFLHIPILFNGLFPLFGAWLSGLEGTIALDITILLMAGLAWGTARQKWWAWWGGLVYLGALTASGLTTLLSSSYAEILSALDLPALEMDMLDGMPLTGAHFAVFVGVPLLITLTLFILSRKHFGPVGPELPTGGGAQ